VNESICVSIKKVGTNNVEKKRTESVKYTVERKNVEQNGGSVQQNRFLSIFLADVFLTISEISLISGVAENFSDFHFPDWSTYFVIHCV
jgi:hypothetical protein